MYNGIIRVKEWPIGFGCLDRGTPADVLPELSHEFRVFNELENEFINDFDWEITFMTHLGIALSGRFLVNHDIESALADYVYMVDRAGINVYRKGEHILYVPDGLGCIVEPIVCNPERGVIQ